MSQKDLKDPGAPPFYSKEFFSIIKEAHEDRTLDIVKMSSKDWYNLILERNISMEIDSGGIRIPKLSRAESLHRDVDWKRTWEMVNIRGMNAERTTFLLKCLYDIVPTKSRLHRLNLTNSPVCDLCEHGIIKDLPHALLGCGYNGFANDWIIAVLIDLDSSLAEAELSSSNIVRLNLEIEDDKKFPVVWFLSLVLDLVLQARQTRKPVSITKIKAMIGAQVSTMMKTNLKESALMIDSAIKLSVPI